MKKKTKAIDIILFALIGFIVVFFGALALISFPPTLFLILVGVCIYQIRKEKRTHNELIRTCTAEAAARLVRLDEHVGMDPANNYNSHSSYHPVYSFMFNGQIYTAEPRAHYGSKNAAPDIGSLVKIYIDPNNPTVIYEPELEQNWTNQTIKMNIFLSVLFGVFAIVIAIAFLS